jgi:hypothetical protein
MSTSQNKSRTQPSKIRKVTGNTVTFTQARRMLPLVTKIVTDIRDHWKTITGLEVEQADLDRRRRSLEWPERKRRYQIGEDIAAEQRRLQETASELEQLNVLLIDPVKGEVAFPTVLGGRKAYFIWLLGETDPSSWCFADEPERHPIPSSANRA